MLVDESGKKLSYIHITVALEKDNETVEHRKIIKGDKLSEVLNSLTFFVADKLHEEKLPM